MGENIKREYVIDASVVLSHLLPDERVVMVDKIFVSYARGKIKLFSTYLLPFETINSLHVAQLRKRISAKKSLVLLKQFLALNINLEEILYEYVLTLTEKEGLTAYDASYVALANEKQIPLLTLDNKLKKLAEKLKS